MALVVALLAGLVSFASPVRAAAGAGFLGYVTGLSDESLGAARGTGWCSGALLFVLGFTVVFIVAIFVTPAGAALIEHRDAAHAGRRGARHPHGAGLPRGGTQREVKLHWRPAAGLAGAPVLGAVFALGWAPCTGPTLAAVLVLATATGDQRRSTRGVVLAVAYALGLGLPFVLIAAGSTAPGGCRGGCAAPARHPAVRRGDAAPRRAAHGHGGVGR